MERLYLGLEEAQQYEEAEKSGTKESCFKFTVYENNETHTQEESTKTIEDLQRSIQNQIKENQLNDKMGFAAIKELTTKDPLEVLLTLNIPSNGFKELLNEEHIGKDAMANILTVLGVASRAGERRNLATLINTVVTETSFVHHHLLQYIISVKQSNKIDFGQLEVLTNATGFLSMLQEIQPSIAEEVLSFLPILNEILNRFQKRDLKILPLSIQKKVESLRGNIEKIVRKTDQVTRDRISTNEESDYYRSVPISPTKEDFTNMRAFPQLVKGKFLDAAQYLDVQFGLLREDFIRPLRERVAIYRNTADCPGEELGKLHIYKNVHILCPYDTEVGVVHLISFDLQSVPQINWEISNRLSSGSLLCLSSDNFETTKIATVSKSETSELKKGKLEIHFEQLDDEVFSISPSTAFVMIETEKSFESLYNTLHSLQKIKANKLPFKGYIVDVDKNIKAPNYLKQDSLYNFLSAFPGLFERYAAFSILNSRHWPSRKELNLDQCQYVALQTALTKEFVVIQGAPGTGKTFLALKIIDILLENGEAWNSDRNTPILVVCHTDHGLDKFLERILTLTKDVVRVGERCTNDKIEEFQLHRQPKKARENNNKVPEYIHLQKSEILKYIETIQQYIEYYFHDIEYSTKDILTTEILKKFIGERHSHDLQMGPSNVPNHIRTNSIRDWLNIQHSSHLESLEIPNDDDEEMNDDIVKVSSGDEDLKLKLYIRKQLKSQELMTCSEAKEIENVWALDITKRWSLYRFWVAQYVACLFQFICNLKKCYQEYSERLMELRRAEDKYHLRTAKVIGITTTDAAKYYEYLQDLQPRIVIVKEAAELLDAHVVPLLTEKTQHFILIGDHQQLRPPPTLCELSTEYALNMFLFERLMKNGMPYHQLTVQHRMRPCIARLLTPHIYPDLKNHQSVEQYENILSVGTNMFFINYCGNEINVVDTKHQNSLHEATFLVQLCKFLRHQGYESSQLTVLTACNGQLLVLEQLMKREEIVGDVLVTTIDKYQGVENDVILISFFNGNDEDSIGFLNGSDRLSVALSRARKGLYCIGNFELLAEGYPLWKSIIQQLEKKNAIGLSLPLYCQNHPETVSKVSKAEDFDKYVPDGGCTKPCDSRIKCDHLCTKHCHPCDKDHKVIKCLERCTKVLCSLGHVCPKQCYEQCEKCMVPVEKVIPKCKHKILVPCCLSPAGVKCLQMCQNRLECGHICKNQCYQPCHPCCSMVEKTFECLHSYSIRCHEADDIDICPEPCTEILRCGHLCTERCGIKPCPPCAEDSSLWTVEVTE